MPDIAMCARAAETCSLAGCCRRHEASGTEPSMWQFWSTFGPPGRRCDSFWLVTSTNGLPTIETPSADLSRPAPRNPA